MCQNHMLVLELNPKHGIRKSLNHGANNFYCILFRHTLPVTGARRACPVVAVSDLRGVRPEEVRRAVLAVRPRPVGRYPPHTPDPSRYTFLVRLLGR